jgi:hypothetical protein
MRATEDVVGVMVMCAVLAFFIYQPLDESGTLLTVGFFSAIALHFIQ